MSPAGLLWKVKEFSHHTGRNECLLSTQPRLKELLFGALYYYTKRKQRSRAIPRFPPDTQQTFLVKHSRGVSGWRAELSVQIHRRWGQQDIQDRHTRRDKTRRGRKRWRRQSLKCNQNNISDPKTHFFFACNVWKRLSCMVTRPYTTIWVRPKKYEGKERTFLMKVVHLRKTDWGDYIEIKSYCILKCASVWPWKVFWWNIFVNAKEHSGM